MWLHKVDDNRPILLAIRNADQKHEFSVVGGRSHIQCLKTDYHRLYIDWFRYKFCVLFRVPVSAISVEVTSSKGFTLIRGVCILPFTPKNLKICSNLYGLFCGSADVWKRLGNDTICFQVAQATVNDRGILFREVYL